MPWNHTGLAKHTREMAPSQGQEAYPYYKSNNLEPKQLRKSGESRPTRSTNLKFSKRGEIEEIDWTDQAPLMDNVQPEPVQTDQTPDDTLPKKPPKKPSQNQPSTIRPDCTSK
jgi:hypothetical protein